MFRLAPLFLALICVTLWSCQSRNSGYTHKTMIGKGGIQYGGVFSVNEIEDFRSLYPLNITDVTGHRIANQVYEGLLKLDQSTLELVGGLAESWEVNDDGTIYTFHLRDGVYFHDDPCFKDGRGRELSARDVKFSLDRLCRASSDNVMASYFLDRVKGASDYYQLSLRNEAPESGVEGIKAINDRTVQIELAYPFPGMMKILTLSACWIYPPEAYERYGEEMRIHGVGTGPFRTKTVKEGEVVILARHQNYWGADEYGNQLPYLDAIKYTFIKEKRTELDEFRKGNLDMVFDLPTEEVVKIREEIKEGVPQDYQFQSIPSMIVQYYSFQHQSDVFDDVNVRKAFNYAIDRQQIVDYALQGKGIPAEYGIVPPCFKEYDSQQVKGYYYDADLARNSLSKAGYPNGEGFPVLTLQLNYGGAVNVQVAEVIQRMLEETLNISIELTLVPRSQHYERVETGKALFWRDGWNADYADPENFLNLFYGALVPDDINEKSYINSIRYKSKAFDDIFEAAMRETNDEKRISLLLQADQVAMDDAAIIPLYYEESIRLLQNDVANFPINPMEYRDFASVRFDNVNQTPG